MAFNVKNDETDRLLRELTALTGESLTDAITISLRDRLRREQRIRSVAGDASLASAIAHFRSLPIIDDRTNDEILGTTTAACRRDRRASRTCRTDRHLNAAMHPIAKRRA